MASPPAPTTPIETIARLVNADEANCRMPSANGYKLYYTATDACIFGLDVCNTGAADALIWVYILDTSIVSWTEGAIEPPPYTTVVAKLRLEADGTDGSVWTMPVKTLNKDDRVVVSSNSNLVTWFGQGFKFVAAT